jgi:hypothetical protein
MVERFPQEPVAMSLPLATMRYCKIEGTAVSVAVTSATEAKAALKELRHKKRELKFLRGALVRKQKAERARQKRLKRAAGAWSALWAGVRWVFSALVDLFTVSRAERRARSPAEIERELTRLDEILHNIDGCLLQLEGKLLTQT